MLTRCAVVVLLSVSLVACGAESEPGSIQLEILNPPDSNPLFGASFIRLRVDGGASRTFPIEPGAPIDVGFNVSADDAVHQLFLEGLDESEKVTSRGQSPPVLFASGSDIILQVVARPTAGFSLSRQPLTRGRVDFALAQVPGDAVYVIGGTVGDISTDTVERVDPYLTEITDAPPLAAGRRGPVAMVTQDGTMLVAAGQREEIEALRPGALAWKTVVTGSAPAVASPGVAALGNDSWMLIGGEHADTGATNRTVTVVWADDAVQLIEGPALTISRDRPAAVALGEDVLVVGGHATLFGEWLDGQVVEGQPVATPTLLPVGPATALVLGGGSDAVHTISRAGGMHAQASLSVARAGASAEQLADGRVIVIGGLDAASLTADILEAVDGRWELVSTAFLSVSRARCRSTVLPDGSVLAIGGLSTTGGFNPRGDIFVP